MTNEQLAILLKGYTDRLEWLLDNLYIELLAGNLTREKSHYYKWIGKGAEPFLNLSISKDNRYEKVEEEKGFICLTPLTDFLSTMKDDIQVLGYDD